MAVQQKAYWLVLGKLGRLTVSVRMPEFFLQVWYKIRNEIKCAIQIAKIIQSYLHRTAKKGKLDPRALLGIF